MSSEDVEQESDPKDGEGALTLPRESLKKGSNEKQSAPERAQPLKSLDPSTKSQSSYFLKVGIFHALAAACIAAAIYTGPPENVTKSNFDLVKIY